MTCNPLSATIASASQNQRPPRLRFRATRLESARTLQLPVYKIRHHQLEFKTTADELAEFATPLVVVSAAPLSARSSGRDGPFGPPPGTEPASGFPAPGSHFGSTECEPFCGPRMKDA